MSIAREIAEENNEKFEIQVQVSRHLFEYESCDEV